MPDHCKPREFGPPIFCWRPPKTLLPSLALIVAPLLQHEPRHRWVARTNQLNLTCGKRRIWERSRHRVMPQPSRLERGAVLPRILRKLWYGRERPKVDESCGRGSSLGLQYCTGEQNSMLPGSKKSISLENRALHAPVNRTHTNKNQDFV